MTPKQLELVRELTTEEVRPNVTEPFYYGPDTYDALVAIVAEVERLRAASTLRWTDELPTKPGWYWWRQYVGQQSTVHHVIKSCEALLVEGSLASWNVSYHCGQWAGPLPEPIEDEKR